MGDQDQSQDRWWHTSRFRTVGIRHEVCTGGRFIDPARFAPPLAAAVNAGTSHRPRSWLRPRAGRAPPS